MYHIIYNPVAGRGKAKKLWPTIKNFLKSINLHYQLHRTTNEGHAEEITKHLTKQIEPITILVIGGDGTLNEVVNGIHNFDLVTIGLIPLGSGNDFAAATRIPLDNPIEAMKFALTMTSKKINFIDVNKKRAINVVGFGLDTDVLKMYYRLKWLPGKLGYKFATIWKTLFFKWHNSQIKIDKNKEYENIRTLLLSLGNGKSIGGGIQMCPLAQIDDDWLDFTYVEHFPRIKTIFALKKVMDGKILSLKFVKSVKCRQVSIHLTNGTYQYDGIIVHDQKTLDISLAKEKINFIC